MRGVTLALTSAGTFAACMSQWNAIGAPSGDAALRANAVHALFWAGARLEDTSGEPLRVVHQVFPGVVSQFIPLGPLPEIRSVNLTGAQVAEDTGVLLTRLPRLSRLCFSYTQLPDCGAGIAGQLHRLTRQIFGGKELPDRVAETIEQLPHLTWLALGETELPDRVAEAIGRLPLLSELVLCKVSMSREAAMSLRHLRSLEVLNMRESEVGSFEFLADLVNLTKLDVSGTRFGDQDMAYLAKHTCLRCLDVMRSPVAEKGLAQLPRAQLEKLRFGGGSWRLTRATVQPLKSFPKLRHIEMSYAYAKVDLEGIEELSTVPGLRYLCLGGSDLDDVKMRSVAKMADLRVLWIPSTRISGKGVSLLRQLPKLEELGIENHHTLSDAVLDDLAQIESLRVLTVRNTDISWAAVKALAQRRPELRVLR